MRGYKGTDMDMKCLDMQYEIGKSYHVDGEISLCERGFHFCESLPDVFGYYLYGGSRYFEVDAWGTVGKGRDKCVASDLEFVRELTEEEVNRCYYGDGYGSGNDNDNGNGDNYYNGNSYGNSYSNSYGNGYGNGNGDDCDNGYGDSDDCGNGNGNGDGNGNSGGNIQRILLFAIKEGENEHLLCM